LMSGLIILNNSSSVCNARSFICCESSIRLLGTRLLRI
jgi:hypothetical protein